MQYTPDVLARVALLDKIVVMHPDLKNALYGIEECMNKSMFYSEPVCCTLRGLAGAGKTITTRLLLSRFPRYTREDEDCERTIIPAFYAEVPSDAHIKSVAASLLEKLGDRDPGIGSATILTIRLKKLLKECETRLVLLDEFHHLIHTSPRKSGVNASVCNWIKGIVNETKVAFCLIGQPEFRSVFLSPIEKTSDQMAKRFQMDYELRMLNIRAGTLKPFLEGISQQAISKLEVDAFPNLGESLLMLKIFAATGGNPSYILALIKEATCIGLSLGNSINERHFETAWDRGVTFTASLTGKENPFTMDSTTLARKFKGDKNE